MTATAVSVGRSSGSQMVSTSLRESGYVYDAVQCTGYLTDTPGRFLLVAYVCTSDGVLRTMDNYHVTRICKK